MQGLKSRAGRFPRFVLIAVSLAFYTCIATFQCTPPIHELETTVMQTSVAHAKIFIDGNDALDAFPDKSGAGNETSPYIIENYTIDAGGSGSPIVIMNTDRNLTISSCTLSGSSHVGGQGGIRLFNCENVLVFNCRFMLNDADGIVVEACTHVSIVSNLATNNTWDGIFIDDSNNCSVLYNIARDNGDDGIESRNSTSVHILHNKMYNSELQGINIAAGSSTNRVRNNTVNIANDYGIMIHGDYNIITNNTVISENCISNVGQGNQVYDNICLVPIPNPGTDLAKVQVIVLAVIGILVLCFFLMGVLYVLTRRSKGLVKKKEPRESPRPGSNSERTVVPGSVEPKPEQPRTYATRPIPKGDDGDDSAPKLLRHKDG